MYDFILKLLLRNARPRNEQSPLLYFMCFLYILLVNSFTTYSINVKYEINNKNIYN